MSRALIRKIAIALFAALVAIPMLAGGKGERHYRSDPASVLYRNSAFAHGFIHGYEDGFRIADDLYQIGMISGDATQTPQYKSADAGYQSDFGSKNRFRDGYRQGFRSGYDDSIQNRRFRAVAAAREAVTGLNGNPGHAFDAGFAAGFETAQRVGLPDITPPCDAELVHNTSEIKAGYCEGFARGARFWQYAVASPGSQRDVQTAIRRIP